MQKSHPILDLFCCFAFWAAAFGIYWYAVLPLQEVRLIKAAAPLFWLYVALGFGLFVFGLAFGYRALTGKRLLGLSLIG